MRAVRVQSVSYLRPVRALAIASTALAVAVVLGLRWTPVEAAFPGSESDTGVHIAIVNQLLRQPFPLPYFGIVGAHAVVGGLHLLGMSIPKAMLVLADLALLALATSILVVLRRHSIRGLLLGLAAFVIVTLPLFSTMMRDGFLGQIVALGLYAVAIAVVLNQPDSLSRSRGWTALGLILAAVICYPDGFMWCAPWLLLVAAPRMGKRPLWISGTAAALIVLFLFLGQVRRLGLDGGGAFSWGVPLGVTGAWVIALLLLTRATASTTSMRQTLSLALLWFLVAGLVGAICLTLEGHLTYYARKNFYFLGLLLPLLAAALARSIPGLLAGIIGLAVLATSIPRTAREELRASYDRVLVPRSVFDAEDERCILEVRETAVRAGCGTTLVLPGAQATATEDSWGERILRVLAANSYVGTVDTSTGWIVGLTGSLQGGFPLARMLQEHPSTAGWRVRSVAGPDVDCFAVGDALLPPGANAACACQAAAGRECLSLLSAGALTAPASDLTSAVGSATGILDEAGCRQISGWAWNPHRPGDRLSIELLSDGEVVGRVLADTFRPDLRSAGIGRGDYAFAVPTPAGVLDGAAHRISMRVADTSHVFGTSLSLSCKAGRP
jgi:hypothetical protein